MGGIGREGGTRESERGEGWRSIPMGCTILRKNRCVDRGPAVGGLRGWGDWVQLVTLEEQGRQAAEPGTEARVWRRHGYIQQLRTASVVNNARMPLVGL